MLTSISISIFSMLLSTVSCISSPFTWILMFDLRIFRFSTSMVSGIVSRSSIKVPFGTAPTLPLSLSWKCSQYYSIGPYGMIHVDSELWSFGVDPVKVSKRGVVPPLATSATLASLPCVLSFMYLFYLFVVLFIQLRGGK